MTDHRPQLHDDIKDGRVKLESLKTEQLAELLTNFTLDYNPDFTFWRMVHMVSCLKRMKKQKEFDRGFFK